MQTIELTFNSGPETLAGTLNLSAQPEPGPAVLLISGSGPLDRNSNMKKQPIHVMGQVAEHLSDQNLTSFRYDKRGVGASSGDYSSTGLFDNVADAAAAIDALRARPEVDPDQIFIIGHSAGALIATELAAADGNLAGVVLLAGTATLGEDVLRWQAGHLSGSLPRAVKLLMRILRKDIVSTQNKRLAQIKATTTDSTRIQFVKLNAKWLREFMAHDPSTSLVAVQVPVLAVTGAKDIQVNPEDVARICQLVPTDCTGDVPENLTHLLRTEAGPPSFRTYKHQAKRPVDDNLLTMVSGWIHQRVTQRSMR